MYNDEQNQNEPEFHSLHTGFVNHAFTAWLPDEILAPKIGEFIESRPMEVLSVSRDEVRVRIGKKQRFWRKPEGFDANVNLSFHREPLRDELTRVEVNIKSNRRIANRVFQLQCGQLLRDIHKCLLARDVGC